VTREVSKRILGKLDHSLVVELDGRGNVALESRTRTKWSKVHNDGGQAGRGAVEPKRETVKVEPADLDVLREILKDHLLLPLEQ
jgi:hypothetical protein